MLNGNITFQNSVTNYVLRNKIPTADYQLDFM